MKDILLELKQKAATLNKTIVLPEGEDLRVIKAAQKTVNEGISKIVLLGSKEDIIAKNGGELNGVTILDPTLDKNADEYAELLFNLRQGKINKKTGMPEYATVEDAKKYILSDYTMYGALMLKKGVVDGMVSGACHSTANTLRPGLQVIKTAVGEKIVSAYFLMLAPNAHPYCEDGYLIFADCALNQNPTSEELAYIALSSAKSSKSLFSATF